MDSFKPIPQKMSHSVSPESGKDSILFRPNAIVAALMLSIMVSPVAHAENIVYESGPLRSNPLMAGSALFPDAASGNTVTNIGKVDGSMFGGMVDGQNRRKQYGVCEGWCQPVCHGWH